MDVDNIIETLSKTHKFRSTIYLNEKEISSLYTQKSEAITKLIKSNEISGNIKGTLNLLIASLEFGGNKTKASGYEIEFDTIKKAIILEYFLSKNKELIDLSGDISDTTALSQKNFLMYIGDSNIYGHQEKELVSRDPNNDKKTEGHPVNIQKNTFTDENFVLIQNIRKDREDPLEKETDPLSTIVLTAITPHLKLASIASTKWIDLESGNYLRYRKIPPFGIFGKYEQKIHDILLIQPFWIWKENQ